MLNPKIAIETLAKAMDKGVSVYLDGEDLKLKAAKKENMSPDLIALIRENKDAIKTFLKEKAADTAMDSAMPLITPREKTGSGDRFPLSFSQEGLWYLDMMEGSRQYNSPAVLRIKGRIDRKLLEYAIREIVKRHEALRTVFLEENGKPYQHLLNGDNWRMNYTDAASAPAGDRLDEYINQEINRPFNLAGDYMVRVSLLQISDEEYIILLVTHHIAVDGWSVSILVNELQEIYKALTENRRHNLPEMPLQFMDYALWQKTNLSPDVLKEKLNWWEEKLSGLEPLNMPLDFPRPARKSIRAKSLGMNLDRELLQRLHEICNKEGVTLFMLLLAAYKVLLHRFSGQNDISVGTPIANRPQQELEGLIGYFLNSLPIRSQLGGNPRFTDFLKQVADTTLEVFSRQDIPFEKIMERVEDGRDFSRTPLYQTMFILLNQPDAELKLGDAQFTLDHFKYEPARFELTLYVSESEKGLRMDMIYCSDLFKEERISQIMRSFENLLNAVAADPLQHTGSLNLLSPAEEKLLLQDFNNTAVAYPFQKTFIDLFAENALATPDQTAVVCGNESLSYAQLHERSNRLAHYLLAQGVEKESLTGVCMNRSVNMLVSILGILKAGAAYLPIDPEYPQQRIEYILDNSRCRFMITDTNFTERTAGPGRQQLILLDRDAEAIAACSGEAPASAPRPEDLAYVIYTSGSTGNPKGVMIEHRGMVNHLFAKVNELGIDQNTRMLQNASQSFDISIWQFLVALVKGGTTYIYTQEMILDSGCFLSSMAAHQLTHVEVVPSYLRVLLEDSNHKDLALPDLRYMLVTGEALPQPLTVQWFRRFPGIPLVNAYGPTEASDDITHHIMTAAPEQDTVPIGHVLQNLRIYVFNPQMGLCPIGVPGEIGVSGIGVGRGYLDNPELTAEKFISNPFEETGYRLYRTGDTGYWLPNGDLVFLGRKDDQVKIRGHRIETGEIETAINAMEEVLVNCVVVKDGQQSGKSLVSYYVPNWEDLSRREESLYPSRVDIWKDIYDENYKDTSSVTDEDFDHVIWLDSFTREPIPEVHMREWQDDIIGLILSAQPRRVLEFGCGTGLIFYRLNGQVDKYIGTDLSQTCVNRIAERVNSHPEAYPETEFQVCPADKVTVKEDEVIDMAIINSVAQYFPGKKYLEHVLNTGLTAMKGRGTFIVGDVRNNYLQKAVKRRICLGTISTQARIEDFNWAVDKELLKDNELCLTPDFFYNLKKKYPAITHVDIRLKQGKYNNEMSLYRFNVTISLGIQKETLRPEWESWAGFENKRSLLRRLQNSDAVLALCDVPNPRLWAEVSVEKGLKDKAVTTVADLREYSNMPVPADYQLVDELIDAATEKGFTVTRLINNDPLKMNLLITPAPVDCFIENHWKETGISGAQESNFPIFIEASAELQNTIREKLAARLPEYMMPARLIPVGNIPLTPNGKLDRNFLTRYEDEVKSLQEFRGPETEMEEKIAAIFRELLQLDKISVYDNFFELGGDSILVIQLVSRARREGLQLQPSDLLDNQTVASLAAIVKTGDACETAESGILTGESPMTPIQHWFFEYEFAGISQFNQAVLVQADRQVTASMLANAFRSLVEHHDALRFKFRKENGRWIQEYSGVEGGIESVDLSVCPQEELAAAISEVCSKYQESLDIEKGELIRAVFIKTPDTEAGNRLFIAVHHLVMDGVSWRILFDQLELLIQSEISNETVSLGQKSGSYRNWATSLQKLAQSKPIENQYDFWQSVVAHCQPLPADHEAGWLTQGDAEEVVVRLSENLTRDLLQEAHKTYRTQIDDILLAALGLTMAEWTGNRDVVIGREGHGREDMGANVDTVNTIGWFTNLYPVSLNIEEQAHESDLIKSVKEQLRSIPQKGMGFGLLRYLHPSESIRNSLAAGKWDIIFNYLGQLDTMVTNSRYFKWAREQKGNCIAGDYPKPASLEIESSISAGRLAFAWIYSAKQYERSTLEELANRFLAHLTRLITHCCGREQSEYTLSDYGLQGKISKDEFEELAASGETDGIDILKF